MVARSLLIMMLLISGSIAFAQQNASALLLQANKLKEQFKEAEALAKYKEVLKLNPNNLEALTNASFYSAREGFRKAGSEKIRLYNDSKGYAERALQIAPKDAEANFVMAVAMGRIAEISDTKEKIQASKDIKRYAEAALDADRSHAGAWHILGKWNYGVKDLGATKLMMISMIYGGMPKASFEAAVECYNKAVTYNPSYILYYYDLAQAYEKLGQKKNALAVLNKALQIPATGPDDQKYLRDCREMAARLK